MAKPAIVAKITAAGTTPSTIRTLEVKSAPMFAWSKASRKLPHWPTQMTIAMPAVKPSTTDSGM